MYNKHMAENINTYVVVGGRPEGNRLLGRTRHRWKNNTELILSIMQECRIG
jgi:hypothetical protein